MAMPCPSCRTSLGLDLPFIIKNPVCVCPNCKVILDFSVDQDLREKFQTAMKEIDDVKKRYSRIAKFK